MLMYFQPKLRLLSEVFGKDRRLTSVSSTNISPFEMATSIFSFVWVADLSVNAIIGFDVPAK